MYFSSRLQYCLTVSKAVQDCTAALGVESVSADAEVNSAHEVDQLQQLVVAGGLGGVILNPPDASNVPSGLNATDDTAHWCPQSASLMGRPADRSHSRMVQSALADTSLVPSGLNPTDSTHRS